MNPCGGGGAVNAFHDAVTLANWINTLQTPSLIELELIFKEYHAERLPVALDAFETSQVFAKNLGKVTLSSTDDNPPLKFWAVVLTCTSE